MLFYLVRDSLEIHTASSLLNLMLEADVTFSQWQTEATKTKLCHVQ